MIITYHDAACVRISAGDTTLVFGPISKGAKHFKPTNFGADVAFVSVNHADMNGTDEAGRGDKQPFVISGPGEYEVKGITVAGFQSDSLYAGTERINTIYGVDFDDLTVLYLGALSSIDIPKEVFELESPDILIVPISGEGTLGPSEAQKLAVKLEAKVVIPILYDEKVLKTFLKEAGSEETKPVDKLTLKSKDVQGKENEVVVISA